MKSETLNKITDALTRLEHGDYGYCFDCGEEIGEKRLRALPSRSAARIAKRRAKTPSSVSVS
jgi:DnaK suppressor protein